MAKRKSPARGIQWISLWTGLALGVALTLGARQALNFFAEGLVSEPADSITYENPEAQELSFRFFDMLTEGGTIDTIKEEHFEEPQATVRTPVPTAQEDSVAGDSSQLALEQTKARTGAETEPEDSSEDSSNSPPELETGQRYLLQVGSFRNAEKANALRAEILLLGLVARTVDYKDSQGGIFKRVVVGPFDTKEQTADAIRRLSAEDIDSWALLRAS